MRHQRGLRLSPACLLQWSDPLAPQAITRRGLQWPHAPQRRGLLLAVHEAAIRCGTLHGMQQADRRSPGQAAADLEALLERLLQLRERGGLHVDAEACRGGGEGLPDLLDQALVPVLVDELPAQDVLRGTRQHARREVCHRVHRIVVLLEAAHTGQGLQCSTGSASRLRHQKPKLNGSLLLGGT